VKLKNWVAFFVVTFCHTVAACSLDDLNALMDQALDDQDEINLQGFDSEQEVKTKMECLGLEFPYIDKSLIRKNSI